MIIKLLDQLEYESSKTLWAECFDDDARFVDWYYRTRTRPGYVLGAIVSGELVSMLHMLPRKMRFGERTAEVCFVAGVATRPDMRRRGICSALFGRAFDIMRDRGFDCTVLQPFSAAFYERFGYRAFIKRQSVLIAGCQAQREAPREYDTKKLVELYAEFIDGYDGAAYRDAEYFKGFIEEFSAPEARLVQTENGCCAGYSGEDGEGSFRAYELFFREGTDPVSLLPPGFDSYEFPLPAGVKTPEGAQVKTAVFSMIKPLKEDFRLSDRPTYGFDMY